MTKYYYTRRYLQLIKEEKKQQEPHDHEMVKQENYFSERSSIKCNVPHKSDSDILLFHMTTTTFHAASNHDQEMWKKRFS